MRILIFLVVIFQQLNAFKILMYCPAFASSHSFLMGKMADTLTNAGHNVTFLIPVVDVTRRNTTGVKTTKDVIFVDQDEIFVKRKENLSSDRKKEYANLWTVAYKPEDIPGNMHDLLDSFIETCDNLLRNQKLFDDLKSRNFDIFFYEPLNICGLGYAYRLGIRKIIQSSSSTFFDYENLIIGEPEERSYVPSLFSQTGDRMNIFERYENFKTGHYMTETFVRLFEEEEKLYTDNYKIEIPPWRELMASASVRFTSANPYLDFPRTTIQKTIMLGGISVDINGTKSQILDEEWNDVLNRKNKTMLISFGTNIKSEDMPMSFKKTFARVIESLPDVMFIWKYESDDTQWADHVTNLHFSKWVPQKALLNDERLTAFLTHGGLGSVNELAYFGKPALMVPIVWDQTRNSIMLSRHGAAMTIRKTELDNYDLLRNSIQSVLYDESYAENARRLADILENQPVEPEELLVKYTEFVGSFGPFPNMDPYVRQLSFVQRTGLDVLAMFYSGYILIFACILLGSKILISRLMHGYIKIE